ncbi:hypothetical protein E4U55_003263 [Claviceps digitariae]|nr:hypothetical protein E4U55_003263 [Claviceps digitariae]
MRIGSSARILAGFLVLATALDTQPALLRIDQENFPDQIYKPECDVCCPITIRTVLSTIFSTIFQDRTQYVTATEHDVATKVEYITQFVTTTATRTYESSYPVTVTKKVGCNGHIYGRSDASDSEGHDAELQQLRGRTHDDCHTTTATEWVTTTATKVVTGIESVIKTQTVPKTVPVPTTLHGMTTVVGSTTIWRPTTYVRTTTVISEHPVTRTVDNTVYTTKSTTVYTTMVSTVATSYPVVSHITESLTKTVTAPGEFTTITKPAVTITKSGQVTTRPAQTVTKSLTQTVTAPGKFTTITKPAVTITKSGQVTTRPAQTIIKSLTQTVTAPGECTTPIKPAVTITKSGQVTTQPAQTITKSLTQTVTAPGEFTTITKPAETISKSGQIVTKPAQTITKSLTQTVTASREITTITKAGTTVTLSAQPSTVSLPAQTHTVPWPTLVSTLTKTLPVKTVEITRDQTTKTIVQPGTTVTEKQTQTLPPSFITEPAKTITVTPIFNVTLCPTPTGSSAPLSPTSDLTFGCRPGTVCNPPKPDWCNFWPGPPADDFLCNPNDCIPSPPFTLTTWEPGKTHSYPPSYGYFNLDPEPFGLSHDIFGYKMYQQLVDDHTTTLTTGNSEPQKSLTTTTVPTNDANPYHPNSLREDEDADEMRGPGESRKDVTAPESCYDDCNNAYVTAESIGKIDRLCAEGSTFRVNYGICTSCIKSVTNDTAKAMVDYVDPRFAQFLDFCSGKKAGKPNPTQGQLESMVTKLPPVRTSSQADTSDPGFTPVTPIVTASTETPTRYDPPSGLSSSSPADLGQFTSVAEGQDPISKTKTKTNPSTWTEQSSADKAQPTAAASTSNSNTVDTQSTHSQDGATSFSPAVQTSSSPTGPSSAQSGKGLHGTHDAESTITESPSTTTTTPGDSPHPSVTRVTAAATRLLPPRSLTLALTPPALFASAATFLIMLF